MYDEYAKNLIGLIPDIPDLDRDECTRALSLVYLHTIRSRLSIPSDDQERGDLVSARLMVRRMSDTLESVAIFDNINGLEHPQEVETACAFVAAEAIALLSLSYSISEDEAYDDILISEAHYTALESGLLYMIGGYDSNASTITGEVIIPEAPEDEFEPIIQARYDNARYALSRIILLCQSDIRQPRRFSPHDLTEQRAVPLTYEDLLHEIRSEFYKRIGSSMDSYLDWLGGANDTGLDDATTELRSVISASLASGYPNYSLFSDIYHLSTLLVAAIEETSNRSLVRLGSIQPRDASDDFAQQFNEYIKKRAHGNERNNGHPFIWPSAIEYISECLPGPTKDAVISMPTGSGKSFIAELAVVNALNHGWVLYLAPTNALAHQIRRDLYEATSLFAPEVNIRAFVGNQEYTTLIEEQVSIQQENFIAVMTPEKCSVALRLFPEQFENCSLCVFDECHLINDTQRGITADIMVSQLSIFAPNIHFLLMSAMVSNATELAEWLRLMRDQETLPISLKWRPSRTMRSFIVWNKDSLETNFEQAKIELDQLPPRRKNKYFDIELALISGLSGPWSDTGPIDYRVTRLPVVFTAKAVRGQPRPQWDSWKNTASRLLSETFALSGIPVLCFMLSSRHHPFSSAGRALERMPLLYPDISSTSQLVDALLNIADQELGVDSILRTLFQHGIAVHTSALLNVEHSASEWMFKNQWAKLMFATGTLAQGLNLPAIAVVVAGTSIGNPMEVPTDSSNGISRANSLILNGFGRAGRPGFSNQGIAILVSDNPFSAEISQQLNPQSVLERYPVLSESDASIEVHSPVEQFINNLISGNIVPELASTEELELTSLLAESQNPGQVLSRTLAAYHKRDDFTPEVAVWAADQISQLKEQFLQQAEIPEWINLAAMKAGVDFFRAWRMWSTYEQFGLITITAESERTVVDWFETFMGVMSQLPPKRIISYLPDIQIKRITTLTKIRDMAANIIDNDTIPWEIPEDWPILWGELSSLVLKYMRGDSYASIAEAYLGLTADQITNSRSTGVDPIPAALNFVRNVVDSLAIDAGCFVAIQELAIHSDNDGVQIPEELQALPLCIRNGLDSLGSLSWYRFGYRQRSSAHALQRSFTVPETLENDTERANWVKNTRRDWISGNLNSEEPILNSAKLVIQQTDGGGIEA